MAYVRWSTMLGRERPDDKKASFDWYREERALVWDASENPEDWRRLAEEQGWHISCWYVFAHTDGGLAIWSKGDDDGIYPVFPDETVRDIVDREAWHEIPGYEACEDDRCRVALKEAVATYLESEFYTA